VNAPAQSFGLRAALTSALEWWDDAGIDTPPVPPAPRARRAPPKPLDPAKLAPSKQPLKAKPSAAQVSAAADADREKLLAAAKAVAGSAPTLEALYKVITDFDAADLSVNARAAVIARGNAGSGVMFIGEAPGKDEDMAGKPFVGKTGQLLDRMLAAIGLDEQSAYITNVCNWRPVNGRAPVEDELALARPFITRHIELAAPKVIVLVGGTALEVLTGQKGITKLRGQWQDYTAGEAAIPAMPLYHPAFLLRRPELKAEAWRDLLAIKARIEGAK